MGERGLYTLSREKHTLADAVTLATTHSLTKKFLGRRYKIILQDDIYE